MLSPPNNLKRCFEMARIRTIKPEFWSDEQVMSCSIHARLLFIGLWNFCDDSGVHPLKPVSLKALIFPGDSIDSTSIRRLLLELYENDLIALYDADGKQYLQVLGWAHQRIDKPTRKYPTQENGIPIKTDTYQLKFEESSKNTRGVVVEESDTEWKGVNQKLSPKSKKPESASAEDFAIFWKLYPRKAAKKDAVKAWTKIKPELVPLIMKSLGEHCACREWLKDDGQFIPYPASWLNGEKFNDEVRPYVAGQTNTGTNRTRSPSLSEQVRQRNAAAQAERQRQAGHGAAPVAELFDTGSPEGGIDWDGEFSCIDDADGKIVGVNG